MSAANPARIGYPVRLTASVSSSLAGNTPSGEVRFKDGDQILDIQFLHDGKVALELPNLSLGAHTITAFYSGDSKNSPSNANALLQVINAGTATATTLNCPASSVVDALLPCIVSVITEAVDSVRLPGQTVRIREADAVLASGGLASGATPTTPASASIKVGGLMIGEHQLQANYLGDAILIPSTSAQQRHTVNPHLPQISRITLGGIFVVGTRYVVAINGVGVMHEATAADINLAGVARALAADIGNKFPGYVATVADAVMTVTGPVKVAYPVITEVLDVSTFVFDDFQEAAAPRPGTRRVSGFTVSGDNNKDYGPFAAILTLTRDHGRVYKSTEYSASNWINDAYIGDTLCQKFADTYPEFSCSGSGGNPNSFRDLISGPIGENDWLMEVEMVGGQGHYGMRGGGLVAAQSTVLTPQSQIINFHFGGKLYPGTIYTLRLNGVPYRYASQPGDTSSIPIMQGLAAAIQSPSFIASIQNYYGGSALRVQAVVPVVPFDFSGEVSAYPITITSDVVQSSQ